MDSSVAKRLGERVIHEAMLFQQRQVIEARRFDGDLEMITAAGSVFDTQLAGVGKRVTQQCFERFRRHRAMVATRVRSTDGDQSRSALG